MYQAILTRIHPATNTKGTRVSARVQHPKGHQLIYSPYDHALSLEANHRALAQRMTLEMQASGLLENGTHITGNWLGDDCIWALTPNEAQV